jgi:GTP cyclohydrolase I
MKTSDIVRQRILEANAPFFANDNIASFVTPEELAGIQEEVEFHMDNLLRALVIDVDNDHNSNGTAKRVAKMFVREFYKGRYVEMPNVTVFPNAKKIDQLYIVGPVSVKSTCSHHLVPIVGKVWVGCIPGDDLSGLSKFARLAEWIFRRPQIQEEATQQLAELLEEILKPKALALIVKAQHMCMCHRGVEDPDSEHTTSYMGGAFKQDPALRMEFLTLMNK